MRFGESWEMRDGQLGFPLSRFQALRECADVYAGRARRERRAEVSQRAIFVYCYFHR